MKPRFTEGSMLDFTQFMDHSCRKDLLRDPEVIDFGPYLRRVVGRILRRRNISVHHDGNLPELAETDGKTITILPPSRFKTIIEYSLGLLHEYGHIELVNTNFRRNATLFFRTSSLHSPDSTGAFVYTLEEVVVEYFAGLMAHKYTASPKHLPLVGDYISAHIKYMVSENMITEAKTGDVHRYGFRVAKRLIKTLAELQ